MYKLTINKKSTLCAIVILLQLIWMQTSILCPNIGGAIYQLIYYMKYIGTAVLLTYILSTPRKKADTLEIKRYVRLFLPWICICVIIEFVALITSPVFLTYKMSYVSRCVAQVLDKACILIMVGCIWIIKKEQAIEFITNVFLTNEVILFVVKTMKVGITRMLLPLISGFGLQDAMESPLEVHEITYCLGFCLIYYLYFKPRKQVLDWVKVIMMIVFILLGGKRMALLGILLSGAFCFFVHKKGLQKISLGIVGEGVCLIALLYIYILYNGDFFAELMSFNVNSMGRDVIYNYFISRTEFTPKFFGYGISAVSKMIENWTRADVGNMVNVRGLHNDVLKIYIDLGFWGLLSWIGFHFVALPIQFFNTYGKKIATLYMALSIYAFITYMTDNTEGYFVFQVTMFVFVLGFYSVSQVKLCLKKEESE